MKTLTYPNDNFDKSADFTLEGLPYGRFYLFCAAVDPSFRNSLKKDDPEYTTIYGLKHAAMLKDVYTAEEMDYMVRMRQFVPIKDGEIVLIDGKQYRTKIIGDYSDAARFIPVE